MKDLDLNSLENKFGQPLLIVCVCVREREQERKGERERECAYVCM